MYSDAEGKTHFRDRTMELEDAEFAPPAPPFKVAAPIQAKEFQVFSFPPHWEGPWHHAPRQLYFFQSSGQLEIEVSDGHKRRFQAGSVIFVDDLTGDGHVTRNIGDDPVTGVFVEL